MNKSLAGAAAFYRKLLNPVLWHFPQVKFMKSKPGAAMVEMGDCYAVDRAITHLNNNFLFGQKLNVWWVHPVQFQKHFCCPGEVSYAAKEKSKAKRDKFRIFYSQTNGSRRKK